MALKTLMLKKKIDDRNKALTSLKEKESEFAKREAELESAIAEASTEEEQKLVEEKVTEFESDKAEYETERTTLEGEIEELSKELEATERADEAAMAAADAEAEIPQVEKRSVDMTVERVTDRDRRDSGFYGMTYAERDAFFAKEEVRSYLDGIRNCIKEKRALTNAGLTIPEVFLGLMKENIEKYSKLYKYVYLRRLGGNGRVVVMGTVPEAVWTDCCANLNELDLTFNDAEVNCWRVAGYFAVCNATIEDSDVDLATELLSVLGQSIGLALDKAILYGNGTRMPLGVVTRLAQTSQPADYESTARTWVDLHTSNIKSIAGTYTGVSLYQQIIIAAGAAKGKYSTQSLTWCMNEATYTKLMAEAMSINAAGAVMTGLNGVMPVLGGNIEKLNFMPDNVIIAGYMDDYLLGERGGNKFASSEHVKFLADQTVFKGVARYDGKPVIAEAFVAIGISGVTPNASMSFAEDSANPTQ